MDPLENCWKGTSDSHDHMPPLSGKITTVTYFYVTGMKNDKSQ
jgi:hypothetical protein